MTADVSRPRSPFPYDLLPQVPAFTLASDDIAEGERMEDQFTAVHDNVSPELHWSGAPQGTRSFVVSCFDPDAPSPSGFWHWTILDLDASVTALPRGAGESDLLLEGAATHVRNDGGTHAWYGPYPPDGDGEHRYVFAVHALDVDTLGLDDEASAAAVACQVSFHSLGRALLTATYSMPGPLSPGARAALDPATGTGGQ
ncbi:YbhB/YbcL family Raf kinase inhibitor-like protein [Actinomyces respiraculi]|uniref:YbhB/YbcL family Raf kinase inhibitor-like protein n=1 Tax=Actinomyces respiraculi TaxID=2744574 RepID=UPI00141FF998|nr:YbhB/YbcL family Raf kinase inhibitor-like protein [Actinomyces respiraculi]